MYRIWYKNKSFKKIFTLVYFSIIPIHFPNTLTQTHSLNVNNRDFNRIFRILVMLELVHLSKNLLKVT